MLNSELQRSPKSPSGFSFPVSAFSSRGAGSCEREDEDGEKRISRRLIRQCPGGCQARLNTLDAYYRQGPGGFQVIVKESPEHNAS